MSAAKVKPVMKAKCSTCLFADGMDPLVRAGMEAKLLRFNSSLECHSTGWPKGTHLCRGGRDFQLLLLYRMGLIDEPTDEAFSKRSRELGVTI